LNQSTSGLSVQHTAYQAVMLTQVTQPQHVVVLLPADSLRLYTLVSDILDHLEVERNRRCRRDLPNTHECDAIENAIDALTILDDNIIT
jgi:hypothetical protein